MRRTTDRDVIEHRLLELAYTTDAKITAQVLAYFAPCRIEDAQGLLDDLTARERIAMEIDDDGGIYYLVPDRQKLEIRHAPPQAKLMRLSHASEPPGEQVPLGYVPLAVRHRMPSAFLAAGLSMLIPGAGHLYAGRVISAILWFLVVSAGYALIVPGLILHVFCMASAASAARQLQGAMRRLQLSS